MASEIFHEDLVAAINTYRGIPPLEGLTRSSRALMFASLEMSVIPPAELLINQDTEVEPRWPLPESVLVGSVEDQVIEFVRDADAVKPGGVIRIFTGEADPDFWNHPLVSEVCLRVTKPAEALIDHYNRGTRMLTQGRPEDARYDYIICERLVDYRLAITPEFLAGLAEEQRGLLRELTGNVFNNFGFVLMQTGKIEAAMPRLRRALEYNPRQVYANNNLGDCCQKLGRRDLAGGYYARELAVNPTHSTAQASLVSL